MQKWPLWQACRISLLTMRGGRGCRYFFDWLYAVTFRNSLPTHLLHEWQNKKVPWYFSKFSWTWKTPPSSFYRKILTFIANGIRKSPMVLFKIFPEDLPSPPFFEKFLTISFPSLKTFRQLNGSIQTYYMFHRNEFITWCSTLQLIMVSMKYELPGDYAIEKAEEGRVKELEFKIW